MDKHTVELWKKIPGTKGIYEASTHGRIRSLKFGRTRIMKAFRVGVVGNQYLAVDIDNKARKVHRLVCETFIGPSGKKQANHRDGNKINNSLENLEWVTPSENVRHAYQTGLVGSKRGEANGHAKLCTDDVLFIRSSTDSLSAMGERFGITTTQVWNIRTRKQWKHVA